ncbi:hypothetical protein TSUD_98720 [Trifolium subterraneum]|uniref:RNase H type-1 domain-containing protein n=1 Tax=Trifolium subterraneum TaxID=3900 RepID=A0A2Z6NT30_TRISU|nr:hypothetical protein TSUD_98720 [Trifolium subterraneum]
MLQQQGSTADANSAHNSAPATATTEEQAVSRATHQMQWQRLFHGWWKCNVDASLSEYVNHTSSAWCIRDPDGSLLLQVNNSKHKLTVAESEATAILEAIWEAISRVALN